ncbi:MAG: hypothetical protein R3A10_21205 [Caldilineaceae bacterium]
MDRHYIDEISGHANVVIVAVVGSGMRGTPGAGRGHLQRWRRPQDQRHRHRPGLE